MECFARRRSESKEGSKSQNGNDQQQAAFLALGSEHRHTVHDEEGERERGAWSGGQSQSLSSLGGDAMF